jgi:hypothetical protein
MGHGLQPHLLRSRSWVPPVKKVESFLNLQIVLTINLVMNLYWPQAHWRANIAYVAVFGCSLIISCRLCERCSEVVCTLILTTVIVFPDWLKSICEGKKKTILPKGLLTNLFTTFSQPIRLQFLIGLLYDLWLVLFDFSFNLLVITFNYVGLSSLLRRIRTFRRWRRRVCTLAICIARTLGCSRRLRMLWSWKCSST